MELNHMNDVFVFTKKDLESGNDFLDKCNETLNKELSENGYCRVNKYGMPLSLFDHELRNEEVEELRRRILNYIDFVLYENRHIDYPNCKEFDRGYIFAMHMLRQYVEEA